MNKQLEVEIALSRISANLSNPITETANLYGVSKIEAEKNLKENIEINEKYATKMEPQEQEGSGPRVATNAKPPLWCRVSTMA
jgi:hypothetical protein